MRVSQACLHPLRKSLGQHLLADSTAVHRAIKLAGVRPTDHVLEIGPGTGNLTLPLLEKAGAVTAIELDENLARTVAARATKLGFAERLRLILGDVTKVPWPTADVLVANIPYQVSSPIVGRLLAQDPPFRAAALLVQKEFGERMAAGPGSRTYSRLSVNCALYADVEVGFLVPASAFRPPPKVDSVVVLIRQRAEAHPVLRQLHDDLPTGFDFHAWDNMLKVCFNGKNKTFRSLLRGRSALSRLRGRSEPVATEDKTAFLDDLDRDHELSQMRANACDAAGFAKLYTMLYRHGMLMGSPEACAQPQDA